MRSDQFFQAQMRKINMKIPPKIAGVGVVTITENDFILKMLFIMGTFFFYVGDLRIKLIVLCLVSGV
jgi:hypothetical protein